MSKKGGSMNIDKMVKSLMARPNSNKIGMIASHLGVVRGTSRDGKPVKAIEVWYEKEILDDIMQKIKSLPGIIDVIVEVKEGKLDVGDPILGVAVAGDFRENVFPALVSAVDQIKEKAAFKKELIR